MKAEMDVGVAVAWRAVLLPDVWRGPKLGVGGFDDEPPGALNVGLCCRYARMKRRCSSGVG